jgi:hypothetical protein
MEDDSIIAPLVWETITGSALALIAFCPAKDSFLPGMRNEFPG